MSKDILLKFISEQGYKKNSPDVDNPINVIPSGDITMNDVEFPVHGVSLDTGETKIMTPGNDYRFDNTNNVLEIPMKDKPLTNADLGIEDEYKSGGSVHKVATAVYNIKNIIPND